MQPTTTGVHISAVNLTDHPDHLGEEAEQHQPRPSRSPKSTKGAVTLSSRYARKSSLVSISFKTVYRGNDCSFLPVLAGNYKRPLDIRNCLGLQNRIRRFSMSGLPAFTIRDCRRARAHRPRSSCPPTKKNYPQGFPSGWSRSVHKPFVYGPPKRWEPQTRGEPQGSKPLCRVPTLQNGRCTNAQKYAQTKGFLDQNRPKRCLPQCSNLDTTPKVLPVHMAGHFVVVCVSSLWAGQCTSGFHKTFKTGGRTVAKDGNKVNYLPKRYPDNVRNQGVSPCSYYHDCQLVIQPRVCHKRRKFFFSLRAHQRIIIPRFSGKLNYNVPIPPKGPDKGYQEGLSTNLRQSDSVGQSSTSPSGKAFILNSSSFSRSPSLSFLAEGQECGFKEDPELRIYPISKFSCSTRVALVEGPSCSLERQVPSKEE